MPNTSTLKWRWLWHNSFQITSFQIVLQLFKYLLCIFAKGATSYDKGIHLKMRICKFNDSPDRVTIRLWTFKTYRVSESVLYIFYLYHYKEIGTRKIGSELLVKIDLPDFREIVFRLSNLVLRNF